MHIQVRAQVPSPGQGLLASCLLEPVSNKYGAWPASGEASAGECTGLGGAGLCGPCSRCEMTGAGPSGDAPAVDSTYTAPIRLANDTVPHL